MVAAQTWRSLQAAELDASHGDECPPGPSQYRRVRLVPTDGFDGVLDISDSSDEATAEVDVQPEPLLPHAHGEATAAVDAELEPLLPSACFHFLQHVDAARIRAARWTQRDLNKCVSKRKANGGCCRLPTLEPNTFNSPSKRSLQALCNTLTEPLLTRLICQR